MRILSVFAASLLALALGVAAADAGPSVDKSRPHNLPIYPRAAEVNGEEGMVELSVLVRPSGRVGDVRVSKSSGFADLDNSAVEGVLGWRFFAAMENGDTVSAWTTVRVIYQLPPLIIGPQPSRK